MKSEKQNVLLSCQKATELVEKQKEIKLSLVERLQLLMHLKMCTPCGNYKKQSKIIDEMLSGVTANNVPKATLSEEKKQALIKKIQKNK